MRICYTLLLLLSLTTTSIATCCDCACVGSSGIVKEHKFSTPAGTDCQHALPGNKMCSVGNCGQLLGCGQLDRSAYCDPRLADCNSPLPPPPAPPPPAPKPKPPPAPPPTPSGSWPTFSTLQQFNADPWAKYYQAVYGNLPTSFPVRTLDLWMLYDLELTKAKLTGATGCPQSVGTCPTANPPLGQRYNVNNEYQPRYTSFSWHPYPYSELAANSWKEVIHMADPFGDEHYGAWFMYAPGSGIYVFLGQTIAFAEHQDAYTHFAVTTGDKNEELSKAAAAQGYDTVQFLSHLDHVSYQCDTQNTGNPGLNYMGMEILGCKLVGTFACGTAAGAPSSIKTGWMASRACTCDNKNNFLNCKGGPESSLQSNDLIVL